MQQTENHYYLKPKLKPNLQSNFFISNFDITSYIIFISYLKVDIAILAYLCNILFFFLTLLLQLPYLCNCCMYYSMHVTCFVGLCL